MDDEARILDLQEPAAIDEEMAARLTAIHDEAFEPAEQQYSMAHILGQVGHTTARLRVIQVRGRVAGYAYLELSSDPSVAFLWYMAVDARMRGRGLGRFVVLDTLRTLRSEHPELRYLLFEVHVPPPEDKGRTTSIEARRIAFYRRLGAYWVRDVDYRIPAADIPSRSIAYDPMFFVLRGKVEMDEVESAILLMAADNFEDEPQDPRWLALQTTVTAAWAVAPSQPVVLCRTIEVTG